MYGMKGIWELLYAFEYHGRFDLDVLPDHDYVHNDGVGYWVAYKTENDRELHNKILTGKYPNREYIENPLLIRDPEGYVYTFDRFTWLLRRYYGNTLHTEFKVDDVLISTDINQKS